MDLADVLSEISQSQGDTDSTYVRHLDYSKSESRRVGASVWGSRNGELVFNGHRVSVLTKKFWRWMGVMVVHH